MPAAVAGPPTTLRRVATLHLGLGGLATAGDVSADGRVVVVRAYTGFFVWGVARGATLTSTLRRAPCRGTLGLGTRARARRSRSTAHGSERSSPSPRDHRQCCAVIRSLAKPIA